MDAIDRKIELNMQQISVDLSPPPAPGLKDIRYGDGCTELLEPPPVLHCDVLNCLVELQHLQQQTTSVQSDGIPSKVTYKFQRFWG